MSVRIPFVLFIILTIFISCSEKRELEVYSLAGTTMGTTYSIKIIENVDSEKLKEIDSKIDSVLVDINNKMSTYIPDSELSQFNKSESTSWTNSSADLIEVLSEAKEVSNLTNNSFDVTVGPLVNLWGFGPEARVQSKPSPDIIEKTKRIIGSEKLVIDESENRIRKTISELYCDLSSIAKGFGVDKVGEFIEEQGLENYMVEIGGEVRTKGFNGKGTNWNIGISSPRSSDLQKVISITNISMATSGDYFNYFEENGIRYSHTIDARTGMPITHKLASVTVLHEQCSYADAFATAINVMGPQVGFDFALKQKLPIFMIVRDSNNFIEKMTPQFEQYIRKD